MLGYHAPKKACEITIHDLSFIATSMALVLRQALFSRSFCLDCLVRPIGKAFDREKDRVSQEMTGKTQACRDSANGSGNANAAGVFLGFPPVFRPPQHHQYIVLTKALLLFVLFVIDYKQTTISNNIIMSGFNCHS